MVWVALAEAITARIPTALSWIGRNLGKIGLGLFAAEQAAEATVWVPGMLGWLPEGQRKQIESNALTISNTLKIVEDRMRSAEIAKREMAEWEKADNRKMLVNARVMLNELTQKVEEFKPNLQATNNYDYFRASIESMEARMSLSEVVNGIKIAPKSTTSKIAGIVKDVHDGDTITLESGEVVRLVGIDSPEASTAAGVVSGDFLRSMISGKSVEVRSDPAKLQDIYNRRLGVVYLGGVNINVEMLKNAYAVPYYMEPNSEVYEKVWTAAYEEGKALNIDKPLGDLKQALYDAYDALKNWRIYGRNELRAAYNAGLDTLRSDEKVELDDIAEAYANALEEMKGIYSEQLADIAARKSAKAITAAAAAEEKKTARTNYLKAKEAAQKWRREEKAKIKDPHKKEKAARYADYQINYKKIDAEYAATRKALRDVYNLNVDAVKNRTGTPGASPPATTATANYPAMPVIAPPQTSIPVITAPAAVVTVPAISTKPVKLTFTYNTPRRVESGITGRYKNELGYRLFEDGTQEYIYSAETWPWPAPVTEVPVYVQQYPSAPAVVVAPAAPPARVAFTLGSIPGQQEGSLVYRNPVGAGRWAVEWETVNTFPRTSYGGRVIEDGGIFAVAFMETSRNIEAFLAKYPNAIMTGVKTYTAIFYAVPV